MSDSALLQWWLGQPKSCYTLRQWLARQERHGSLHTHIAAAKGGIYAALASSAVAALSGAFALLALTESTPFVPCCVTGVKTAAVDHLTAEHSVSRAVQYSTGASPRA